MDFTIAGAPYDMYDIGDIPKYELMDLVLYLVLYPMAAYLVLWLYDKYAYKGWKLMTFLFAVTAATVLLEYVSLKFNVFRYNENGWRLSYSWVVYYLVWSMNIGIYHLIKKTPAREG